MNRLEIHSNNAEEESYFFHCPGCKCGHVFYVRGGPGPRWTFNGDLKKPTIRPSYLIGKDDPARRCHSYITAGRIRFLEDCFHELRGQTVDLPEPW